MRLGPALRTNQLHVLPHFVPQSAPLPLIVGALRCAAHFPLRARTRDRHLDVRGAIEAQSIRTVEALAAHIIVAIPAAVEMPLAVFDRFLERLVARAVPARLGHAVQYRARIPENPAEQARPFLQPAAGLGAPIRFECRAPAVEAALAIELELEAGIDAGGIAEILDITGEFGFDGHAVISSQEKGRGIINMGFINAAPACALIRIE
jgi:hypothetical protein